MDGNLEREVSQLFNTVETLQRQAVHASHHTQESDVRVEELEAMVIALETELKMARTVDIEKEVTRRMKPLLEQTQSLAAEVEGMAEQRAQMERAHQSQVRAFEIQIRQLQVSKNEESERAMSTLGQRLKMQNENVAKLEVRVQRQVKREQVLMKRLAASSSDDLARLARTALKKVVHAAEGRIFSPQLERHRLRRRAETSRRRSGVEDAGGSRGWGRGHGHEEEDQEGEDDDDDDDQDGLSSSSSAPLLTSQLATASKMSQQLSSLEATLRSRVFVHGSAEEFQGCRRERDALLTALASLAQATHETHEAACDFHQRLLDARAKFKLASRDLSALSEHHPDPFSGSFPAPAAMASSSSRQIKSGQRSSTTRLTAVGARRDLDEDDEAATGDLLFS